MRRRTTPHNPKPRHLLIFNMSTSSGQPSSPAQVIGTPLPDYSFDDPEMSFPVREQQRRFTTITLREIRYPLGCPCHPKGSEAANTQSNQYRSGTSHYRSQSPDSRPAIYTHHSRPEIVQRSNSSDSTTSTNSNDSTRSRTARQALGNFFRRISST